MLSDSCSHRNLGGNPFLKPSFSLFWRMYTFHWGKIQIYLADLYSVKLKNHWREDDWKCTEGNKANFLFKTRGIYLFFNGKFTLFLWAVMVKICLLYSLCSEKLGRMSFSSANSYLYTVCFCLMCDSRCFVKAQRTGRGNATIHKASKTRIDGNFYRHKNCTDARVMKWLGSSRALERNFTIQIKVTFQHLSLC